MGVLLLERWTPDYEGHFYGRMFIYASAGLVPLRSDFVGAGECCGSRYIGMRLPVLVALPLVVAGNSSRIMVRDCVKK